jgi:hypothetical protein
MQVIPEGEVAGVLVEISYIWESLYKFCCSFFSIPQVHIVATPKNMNGAL